MAKIGKILLAVATIAAIAAITFYAPQIGVALGVSQFLVVAVGTVAVTLASTALSAALFKPPGAKIEDSKVNARIPEPPRYVNGGVAMQGGAAMFGEFDSAGDFWYVMVHCDSILTQTINYYFDDNILTFDGTGTGKGWVTNNEFCLTKKREAYTGSGVRVPYFYIWTRTYTETNPVPPPVVELQSAFPSLWTTIDHLLVGTTYSVVRCKAIKIEDRYKMYRWRGPFGLGEPALAIAAVWSNVYDPRDPSQVLGNRSTYKPSRNSALIWAWFRTHPFGRNKPENSINWGRIAEQANICDQSITGIESTQPRYECGIAIIDSKPRFSAEQEILMSCDGQIVFDEDGKTWCRVGYYYAPTLAFSRNRDIVTMVSVEAQEGESETQGVVVNYLDPQSGYVSQSSAAWYNPNYYKPGEGNIFLNVDILSCQNHNQAMRLAKSIGMRSQPIHKLGPTVGLRGLRAMQERICNITYDNTFAGDYEICTPVEIDESGQFCSLGLCPMDPDRFNLLAGEEKPKPVYADIDTSVSPLVPTGVTIGYANNRIEAHFSDAIRDDATYDFEYIATSQLSSDQWSPMTVQMDEAFAFSGIVDQSVEHKVRYRTRTAGGAVTAWSAYVTVAPMPVQSDPPTLFTVNGGSGANTVSWRNPTNPNFVSTKVWRNTVSNFGTATQVSGPTAGGLGQVQGFTDTLAAGTYYYWIIAYNTNNTASNTVGPVSGVVT